MLITVKVIGNNVTLRFFLTYLSAGGDCGEALDLRQAGVPTRRQVGQHQA